MLRILGKKQEKAEDCLIKWKKAIEPTQEGESGLKWKHLASQIKCVLYLVQNKLAKSGTFCKNTLWIDTLWKHTLWGKTL